MEDHWIEVEYKQMPTRKHEVKFFYVLSNEALKADLDQISALTSLDSPTNIEQLCTILGMFSCLAKFVSEFAHKVVPLRNMLSKDRDRTWTIKHQKSFVTFVAIDFSSTTLSIL